MYCKIYGCWGERGCRVFFRREIGVGRGMFCLNGILFYLVLGVGGDLEYCKEDILKFGVF